MLYLDLTGQWARLRNRPRLGRNTDTKHTTASLVAALVAFGVLSPAWAVNLKGNVNVEIESAQFHAGMNPGTDMCAAQHPHIGAVVENRADVRLERIKVAGNVFDGDGYGCWAADRRCGAS